LSARRVLPTSLYLLIVAGSLLRIVEPFVHNPMDNIFSDPERHWIHAGSTLSPPPWAIIDQPIFQMWLSLVQKWSLGLRALIATYAGLLSAITPWFWYRFLRECLRSRTLALFGWALLAWLPSWVGIFSYFMTETLFLPLMGWCLWQTMRARRKRTLPSFCGMVALWAVAGMTRGIGAPLGALASLWVWLYQPWRIRSAVVAGLIVLLMTVPISIRNHRYLHLWSPLGSGWPNQIYAESGYQSILIDLLFEDDSTAQYGFISPSLVVKPLAPLSDWEAKRSGVLHITADTRNGDRDWRSAYRNHVVRGPERLRLRWENLVLVMLGPSWPDNNPTNLVHRIELAMRWIWLPLFLVVLSTGARWYRSILTRPLVPALIGMWFLFQAVSLFAINEGRYRKPLEGLLIAELLVLLDNRRVRGRVEAAIRSETPQASA
jgi:hypothetical protein